MRLELDTDVLVVKTLKHLTKLLDRLEGIGHGHNKGMESRSIMVLENGMFHKLKEEIMFIIMFLAYLNIGGEYFPPLFSFVLNIFLLRLFVYFCVLPHSCSIVLEDNKTPSIIVNLYSYCTKTFQKLWPLMIVCYTVRVYGVLASQGCIVGLNHLVWHMTLGTQ